jgi:hypothetical protein
MNNEVDPLLASPKNPQNGFLGEGLKIAFFNTLFLNNCVD